MNYLLVGTRKGLIVYQKQNEKWENIETHFVGIPVSMVFVDKGSGTWWACLDHGHWGKSSNIS